MAAERRQKPGPAQHSSPSQPSQVETGQTDRGQAGTQGAQGGRFTVNISNRQSQQGVVVGSGGLSSDTIYLAFLHFIGKYFFYFSCLQWRPWLQARERRRGLPAGRKGILIGLEESIILN